ncbi:MAG: glutamate 5-kinase [Phycisphaeraceae bacterium]|nr:MAG: glutamate 5-kinase [Phycisphaeraceae bacterium]
MTEARANPRPSLAVVKIGSAVVAPGGRLAVETVQRLADEIVAARRSGTRVVLVSSGAVACGLEGLGFERMPAKISDRQAAAAVGQPLLMRAWTDAFGERGVAVAQVLLTADDIDFRARFVNAHRTLTTLLERGVVPIINENDSVSFDEIKLGDNDRLSALAAGLVGAGLLVMLSSVDGLHEQGGSGAVIGEVSDIAAARTHVSGDRTSTGVGGMATKLDAAETARLMGADAVIARGEQPGVLGRVLRGEAVGTRFPAPAGDLPASTRRKQWIAHSIRPRGVLVVDDGAARALCEKGASLLPKGVVAVEPNEAGGFGIGAAVEVRRRSGETIAKGLVAYRSDEIERIMGRRSDEIERVLGYTYCDDVIHRDDLIVTDRV